VKKGDRVVIYLPMSIEGIVAMQACARIGATHSVVFGGFSAQSLRDRISDAGAVMLITADEQCRGGKNIPLKPIVDEAFGIGGCEACKTVIVYKRTGGACNMVAGRDEWLHELTAGQPDVPASRNGSMRNIRCSCSTPPVPPASPRACSIRRAATCCTPS
jgi:acetyl-CoA synthetase